MGNRGWFFAVVGLAVWALPQLAEARCIEGSSSRCVGANGCEGERTCRGGYVSRCECETTPPVPCSICGRASRIENGVCRPLPEICNACDDDRDGVIDNGISCLGTGPFTPRCPRTLLTVSLPMALGSLNGMLPHDYNAPPRYAHNTSYRARVHTNPLVTNLQLHLGVNMVNAFDIFFARNVASGTSIDLHGPSGGWVTFPVAGAGQGGGVELNFVTDSFLNDQGWFIGGARVSCGTPNASGAALLREDDADVYGVLTGPDDVVFFQVQADDAPFALWLDGIEYGRYPLDADLYARWDALPERNVFDFSSRNTGHSDEWIPIDAPRPGRTLFIAVHSRSGVGAGFGLRMARTGPGQRWTDGLPSSRPLRVQTSFLPTQTQLSNIRDVLAGSQRFMMGVTEGKVQLRTVELHVRAGDCTCDGKGCDLCFRGIEGRAFCAGGMGTIYSNYWDVADSQARFGAARVVAHELGHCVLGLDDEYRDHGVKGDGCEHSDDRCTTTIMSNHDATANLCNAGDHGRNTSPLGHVCATCPWTPWPTWSGQACTNGRCNACTIAGTSDWEDLVANKKVLSRPLGTANHLSYQEFRGFPFNVVTR